jgi:hypothetical protein
LGEAAASLTTPGGNGELVEFGAGSGPGVGAPPGGWSGIEGGLLTGEA